MKYFGEYYNFRKKLCFFGKPRKLGGGGPAALTHLPTLKIGEGPHRCKMNL